MLNRYVFNGRSIICVSPTSRETEDTLCVLPRGGTMSLKARANHSMIHFAVHHQNQHHGLYAANPFELLDPYIYVWDLNTMQYVTEYYVGYGTSFLASYSSSAYGLSERLIVVAALSDIRVLTFDYESMKTNKKSAGLKHLCKQSCQSILYGEDKSADYHLLQVLPHGKRVYLLYSPKKLVVFDLLNNDFVPGITTKLTVEYDHIEFKHMSLSSSSCSFGDGKYLYIACTDGCVRSWDTETWEPACSFDLVPENTDLDKVKPDPVLFSLPHTIITDELTDAKREVLLTMPESTENSCIVWNVIANAPKNEILRNLVTRPGNGHVTTYYVSHSTIPEINSVNGATSYLFLGHRFGYIQIYDMIVV